MGTRVSTITRSRLFAFARNLSPVLGGLFQNDMEVSPSDFDMEIREAQEARARITNQIDAYVTELFDLKMEAQEENDRHSG